MSMEQAILELAAGMKELAAAVRERSAPLGALADSAKAAIEEIKQEVIKAPAEPPTGRAADGAEQPIAEEIKAVSDAIEAKDSVAPADLDYTKDVRPVLLAVNKKAGQPALKALLTKFGAATGDKLKPEQFTEVLAEANKILAG